jgi:HSP20 family protein
MRALVPEPGVTTFRKEMNRLFDRIWDGDEIPSVGAWTPKMDVSETREALVIEAEVPGMDPKDLHLTLENGVLTLQGEKKEEIEDKDERTYRSERVFGSFSRGIRLPGNVEGSKVTATFKNGVVTIVMPKLAEARGLSIPILPK